MVLGFRPTISLYREKSSNKELPTFCEAPSGWGFPMFARPTAVHQADASPCTTAGPALGHSPSELPQIPACRDGKLVDNYSQHDRPRPQRAWCGPLSSSRAVAAPAGQQPLLSLDNARSALGLLQGHTLSAARRGTCSRFNVAKPVPAVLGFRLPSWSAASPSRLIRFGIASADLFYSRYGRPEIAAMRNPPSSGSGISGASRWRTSYAAGRRQS